MQHYNERLSRQEAEDYLGLAHGTLAVWASTKRYPLPYVKVGSRVFYRLQDLEAFIASRTIHPSESGINQ